MGINAQLLGKNVTTGTVEDIQSTQHAIHTYDVNILSNIGNTQYGNPRRIRGFVFGRRTGIGNTWVDLWEGPTAEYVFPTAPMQMQVVSTSANDTAAGTGVQRISITYLDNLYNRQVEEVTLNGTTPVLTVATNILRINSTHSVAVGTNRTAVGNVSVQAVGGATTYAFITSGGNYARQAVYTVPEGGTAYVAQWQLSSGSSSGTHFTEVALVATCHDGQYIPGVFIVQDEHGCLNGGDIVNYPILIPLPQFTDIRVRAISDASNANVTAMSGAFGFFDTLII